MISTELGLQIASLRKARGLTQEQLATAAGYSVEFISLVERGINAPSIAGCERIAQALGVPIRQLFDFSNEAG
ncbi:MAG TPA: helix-turn-helix transcriptional regulator [Thiobacillaceae bacterium]|nr:helix-turn-helix transcriptional regulator [Thiobacillaceae bacterium]